MFRTIDELVNNILCLIGTPYSRCKQLTVAATSLK